MSHVTPLETLIGVARGGDGDGGDDECGGDDDDAVGDDDYGCGDGW